MTIRQRTDSLTERRVAGAVAVVGLGAAGVLHAAWARGSSWPAANPEQLADLVVGKRPFPSPQATWVVTALLGTATTVTAARAGLVPFPGGRAAMPIRVGSKVIAATLLARGAIGMAVSGLGLGGTTPQFRRWNLTLFSPLCLVLGTAAAIVSRSGPEEP